MDILENYPIHFGKMVCTFLNFKYSLSPSIAPVMDNQEPNNSFTIFFKLSKYSTSCIKTFHAQEHF